ncbi:hypothetical protein ACSBR2_026967 [Camellia fascicularis]
MFNDWCQTLICMEDFGNAMAEQHEGVTHSEEGVSHIAGVLHSGDGDGLTQSIQWVLVFIEIVTHSEEGSSHVDEQHLGTRHASHEEVPLSVITQSEEGGGSEADIKLLRGVSHRFLLRKLKRLNGLTKDTIYAVGELFGHVRKRQPWADPKIVKQLKDANLYALLGERTAADDKKPIKKEEKPAKVECNDCNIDDSFGFEALFGGSFDNFGSVLKMTHRLNRHSHIEEAKEVSKRNGSSLGNAIKAIMEDLALVSDPELSDYSDFEILDLSVD